MFNLSMFIDEIEEPPEEELEIYRCVQTLPHPSDENAFITTLRWNCIGFEKRLYDAMRANIAYGENT